MAPARSSSARPFTLVYCQEYTLVHYVGDSGAFMALPHQGSKEGSGYVCTLPSYMEELERKAAAL